MGLGRVGPEVAELPVDDDFVGRGACFAAAEASELGVAGIAAAAAAAAVAAVVVGVVPEIVGFADSRSAERFE